jgi:hypothetical protein
MNYDITNGVQTLTAAGVVSGTLNTSSLSGAYTVFLNVAGLTEGAAATIAIEDTANGSSPFSDAQQQAVFSVGGEIEVRSEVTLSFQNYQVGTGMTEADTTLGTNAPRFGSANTQLRAHVLTLTGSSPSLSVHAWLEQ